MDGERPDPSALDPQEIYRRAEAEGERRLSLTLRDQALTGFIAGVTIVFGIVALGVTEALVEPSLGAQMAKLAGSLAFAVGLVFLIVGRTELFSENFLDPVAAALKERQSGAWARLARLWGTILVFNLVGGAVLLAVVSIDGALPEGAPQALVGAAEETADKTWEATLARAVLAGALVALLSYMLNAVNTVLGRIVVAYMVGFLLALGPFDHVVVSALHLLFGIWEAAAVSYADLGANIALATVGNVAGGLLLITLTHTAQVKSERG
jgi:formate/nitrite transporter FocA (FNT family)